MTTLRKCHLTGEEFLPAEGNRRVHRSNAARNTAQFQNGGTLDVTKMTADEDKAERAAWTAALTRKEQGNPDDL